jgi:hypothetical protein
MPVIAIAMLDLHAMLALFGLALLLSLLAPRRVAAGVERIATSTLASAAVGVAVFLVLIAVSMAMWHLHIRPGRGAVAAVAAFALAAGYAVSARALGERALPERGPLAQTFAGLAALVLPLALPIGLPVLVVAAPLGLGAWLTGKSKSAV